jgi:hypothetical protein
MTYLPSVEQNVPAAARIVLMNLAFVVALVAFAALAAANRMDSAAFGLPAVLAVWVVVQGALFARRRFWVVTCAVVGCLLLVLQVALLAFLLWWNRGFGNTQMATQSLVLIIWVVVAGAALIGLYLRAKRGKGRSA